jgi:hypothetical protein
MESASATFFAVLRIKNNVTGDVIAEVKSKSVTVAFVHPFSVEIKNEPEQSVDRRAWTQIPGTDETPCQEKEYLIEKLPGVYVLSGDPFFAQIEASFRDAPLEDPLNVVLRLTDPKTGNTSEIIEIPEARGQSSFTLQTANETDETLDRAGQPSGAERERSLIRLTLPPGNVPGDFVLSAEAEFNGYTRNASLEIHYEPILNIDLTLTSFQPDNVDITEQSAFVYLAPFSVFQSQKTPVPDFTITDWTIRPLCNPKIRPLFSEDTVQGVGVKAFTRSGLAQRVFWGPGDDVEDEQTYEVAVTAQSNGMTGIGFGMLKLIPPEPRSANRILLRSPSFFSLDSILSDGDESSVWEVVAKPEDDPGSGPGDITSGQFFRNAIVSAGGVVPSLEDGRIIVMTASIEGQPTGVSEVLSNVRIKTNMTGLEGRARSAKARIQSGKATFTVSCNARVPRPKETISEDELQANLFYGVPFGKPTTGLSIILTVHTTVEINGASVAFMGGGRDLVTSSPPAFIELIEPLRPA